jgi:peptide/nickel transport system substrate-binding protein
VVNAIYGDPNTLADQMFHPDHWGFNPDVRVIEYDVDVARAKLAEAGWADSNGDGIVDKDGQELAFTVIVEGAGTAVDAQAFQDYMAEIGIGVSVEIMERAVWRELRAQGEWESFLGWDGDAIQELALNNRGTGGWWGLSNPRIDELLEVMSSSLDAQARTDAAQEIVAISHEEAYAIPYYYYQSKIAVRNNIKGLQDPPTNADFQATGVFYHLEDLYMEN